MQYWSFGLKNYCMFVKQSRHPSFVVYNMGGQSNDNTSGSGRLPTEFPRATVPGRGERFGIFWVPRAAIWAPIPGTKIPVQASLLQRRIPILRFMAKCPGSEINILRQCFHAPPRLEHPVPFWYRILTLLSIRQ